MGNSLRSVEDGRSLLGRYLYAENTPMYAFKYHFIKWNNAQLRGHSEFSSLLLSHIGIVYTEVYSM